MTIVLTFTRYDGTQEEAEFEDDVSCIDLSVKILTRIDLSPLATCTSLQKLDLFA